MQDKTLHETRDVHWTFEHPQAKEISTCDSEMKIVIPTLGREETQKVIYQFPDELKSRLFLATRKASVDKLRKHNPGFNILELPDETDGIADTRQRCIDLLPIGKVWMLDDMVKLQKRTPDMRVTGAATPEEVKEMYDLISEGLDYYPMVGLSPRPGNNRVEQFKKDIIRSYSCYGLRTDIFKEVGISFDGMYKKDQNIKLFEDNYLILSLLTNGFLNTNVYEYVCSHTHNLPGGNSTHRNNDTQRVACEALQREFPDFVKVVEKEGKKWGQGMDSRPEVHMQWKKAFLSYGEEIPDEAMNEWF